RWRHRVRVAMTTAIAHQVAQATCRLGSAADRLAAPVTPCGSAESRTLCAVRMSVMPPMANRGGATGQVQNTMLAPIVDSTRADRSRGKARGRHTYSQAR